MTLKRLLLPVIGLCLVSAALPVTARAGSIGQSLILGLPSLQASGNCDPFGCPAFFGLGAYQQVYSSGAFNAPISIDGLSFFDTVIHNGGRPAAGTYTLEFSYTSMNVAGLDLQDPSPNIAGAVQPFFTGLLPALSGGMLTFSGTPFLYDPGAGNLLLTVTVTSPADSYSYLYLNQAAAPTQTSNAYFGAYQGNPISGGNTAGLVTQFDYTAPGGGSGVPEPSSWLLVSAGMTMGAALLVRRRLQARAAA